MIEQLRAAIYTRLTSGTPLGSVPVYDYVPRGAEAAPPYVYIGASETKAQDTDTSDGAEVVTTLHVFTKYQGSKHLAQAMDDVCALFHHYALSFSGAHVIVVTAETGETLDSQDGETREGIVSVRVLLDDITP